MSRPADCRPSLLGTSRRPRRYTSCIRKGGISPPKSAYFLTTPPSAYAASSVRSKQGVEVFRVTDRLSDSDRVLLIGETLARVYDGAASRG